MKNKKVDIKDLELYVRSKKTKQEGFMSFTQFISSFILKIMEKKDASGENQE